MPRYAVLRDLDDVDLRPIALVTEHPDRVRVHVIGDLGLRSEYTGDYSVIEPDGSEVVYTPGEAEYFDHVLLSLSRTFVVGEVEDRAELSAEAIFEIYYSKVLRPRISERVGQYVVSAEHVTTSVPLIERRVLAAASVSLIGALTQGTTYRLSGPSDVGNGHEHRSSRIPAAA